MCLFQFNLDLDFIEDDCPVCAEPLDIFELTPGEIKDVECPDCESKTFDLFEGICSNDGCGNTLDGIEQVEIAEEHGYILILQEVAIVDIAMENDSYLCCGLMADDADEAVCPVCPNPADFGADMDMTSAMPTFDVMIDLIGPARLNQLDLEGIVYAEPSDLLGLEIKDRQDLGVLDVEALNCSGCYYKSTAKCLSFVQWLKEYITTGGDIPGRIEKCFHFIEFEDFVAMNDNYQFGNSEEVDLPKMLLGPDEETEPHFREWFSDE